MNEYKYHDGGECPVDRGVLVDVKFRNGVELIRVSALTDICDDDHVFGSKNGGYYDLAIDWDHDYVDGDIIEWRLSEAGK